MLLLHQTGAVHVGEVIRYTLTYTPSQDRILPAPKHLHVRIKNTSAIPLRAAYLHGPYTLYVSCCPSTFDPFVKHENVEEEGEPEYEPQLKAGGSWSSKLSVPEWVRESASLGRQRTGGEASSFSWTIEVASQVLFSSSAAVHYEILIGRDEKSLSLGFTGIVSSQGMPGRLEDHQQGISQPGAHTKGVFSKAVRLKVEDTTCLWNKPAFPHNETGDEGKEMLGSMPDSNSHHAQQNARGKKKKIHLVVITHGIHSNTGADMLFLKEHVDATARQAKVDAKAKREEARSKKKIEEYDFARSEVGQRTKSTPELHLTAENDSTKDEHNTSETGVDKGGDGEDEEDDEDEEDVIVRGFNGNVIKTEKGIQYLGKRLAKYVLSMTYPDQPFLPVKTSLTQSISRTLTGSTKARENGRRPIHKHSTIVRNEEDRDQNLPYKITKISFIGHSLGGLTQTYAVAYIQKHSPEFFDKIEPINFIALATPFLGLSNENPIYVKFALDFGLVGRTGQDLGLTWRAPTVVKSGWGAMMGGFSSNDTSKEKREQNPGAKPLLRILPTGPAHVALKRFRNRSVYSNVVNDGIVPLRTSCLLFLDWRGLGRVAKARRENGLVGTMLNWGINEMTGQNASVQRRGFLDEIFGDGGHERPISKPKMADPDSAVPQAEAGQSLDEDEYHGGTEASQYQEPEHIKDTGSNPTLWSSLTSFFRPHAGHEKAPSQKQQKIFQRGQTMQQGSKESLQGDDDSKSSTDGHQDQRRALVRGSSLYSEGEDNVEAPPRTSVFESAGDLLSPPLPPKEFLLDPAARPRTIFHDRVYLPQDIPPPAVKRSRSPISSPMKNNFDSENESLSSPVTPSRSDTTPLEGGMKIEEKIARAYHKDMAWRKVLVRLEPDAHNNIIVRRMFANAYGWPVVKHLCDTHFGFTEAALTRDEDEEIIERAKPAGTEVDSQGEEVTGQTDKPKDERKELASSDRSFDSVPTLKTPAPNKHHTFQDRRSLSPGIPKHARTPSENREATDEVSTLVSMHMAEGQVSKSIPHSSSTALHSFNRQDSGKWSDRFFDGSEDDSEDDKDLDEEWKKAYDRGRRHLPPLPASDQGIKVKKSKSKSGLHEEVFADESRVYDEPDEMTSKEQDEIDKLEEEADSAHDTTSRLQSPVTVGLTRTNHGLVTNDNVSSIGEEVARARSKEDRP